MKRLLAALLCVMMVLVLFPVSALAAEGTAAPDSGNYFETPFRAKVLPNGYIGALYLMNQPEVGHQPRICPGRAERLLLCCDQ